MVTPLNIDAIWLRYYLLAKHEGLSEPEARLKATESVGIKGKAFARCHISTGTLTVPVEGGGNSLKRRNANPILSEHGKWRREHLGAWQAAYGRTPYFIHLLPEIEEVYNNSSGLTLEQFNSALLEVALRWLDFEAVDNGESRLRETGRELEPEITDGLSVFDLIFRHGKMAVFPLYPW